MAYGCLLLQVAMEPIQSLWYNKYSLQLIKTCCRHETKQNKVLRLPKKIKTRCWDRGMVKASVGWDLGQVLLLLLYVRYNMILIMVDIVYV